MDFPGAPVTPLFISALSRWGSLIDINRQAAAAVPSIQNYIAANRAIYVPLALPFPYPVRRVWWVNGSAVASNMDIGIYTADGAKIYSAGSTAQSGASTFQYLTPSPDFILSPGRYYLALVCSGTTNAGYAYNPTAGQARVGGGLLQQATALPLPASMTPVAAASNFVPVFGMTKTTTGF